MRENDGNEREDGTPAYPKDEHNQSADSIPTDSLFADKSEPEEAQKIGEEEQSKKSDDHFGNWENQDNAPYTVVSDDTRRVLSENPDPVGAAPPATRGRNEPNNPERQGMVQASHERDRSREGVGMRQYPDPSPNHENMAHMNAMESEQSVDPPPLHRQAKAKVRYSASWTGNRSYETQMKPFNKNRSDDEFDKAAGVLKFGGWNNDPASAEDYAHIFNEVGEPPFLAGVGWGAAYPTSAEEFLVSTIVERETKLDDKPKGCCFCWFSK